jgi:hypothetical protein
MAAGFPLSARGRQKKPTDPPRAFAKSQTHDPTHPPSDLALDFFPPLAFKKKSKFLGVSRQRGVQKHQQNIFAKIPCRKPSLTHSGMLAPQRPLRSTENVKSQRQSSGLSLTPLARNTRSLSPMSAHGNLLKREALRQQAWTPVSLHARLTLKLRSSWGCKRRWERRRAVRPRATTTQQVQGWGSPQKCTDHNLASERQQAHTYKRVPTPRLPAYGGGITQLTKARKQLPRAWLWRAKANRRFRSPRLRCVVRRRRSGFKKQLQIWYIGKAY